MKTENGKLKKYKLGEYIDSFGDGIHGTPNYDEKGEYYFINGNNLKDGQLNITEDTLKISSNEYSKIKRRLIPNNTILVSINGTLGNVALYKSENIALGKSACYLNLKDSSFRFFLRYLLKTKEFKNYMNRVAGQSTIKNVSPTQISEYEFFAPPLESQKKIAAVLSSLDDKIALNNRINAKLEQMAKRLYEHWFVQFDFPVSCHSELVSESHSDEMLNQVQHDECAKPYKSTGGKMVWNEELKREIPEGWEVKKLGEILILLKDGTHNPPKRQEKGIPLLTGTMFGNNFLDYDKATYISEADYKIIHSQYEPHENDVIITKIGTLGNVNLLRNIDIPVAIHCNSALLRFDMALGVYYPFSYCKSDLFKMRLKAIKGQSIQEFASLDRISSIKSEVPCVDIINKFDKIVKPIIEKQKSISFENKKLKEMRDKLLPLLMNGQVVVK